MVEHYLAYILFLLIGLILGIIGGGGSILGVPVLVYLLHYHVDVATGYSLFIVGITSLVGAISVIKKGDISFESLVQFAIPSLITVFCVRKFIIPSLPDVFFNIEGFKISKQMVIMCLFSILIFISSLLMIRKKKKNQINDIMWDEFARSPIRLPFVIILGVAIGFITGFIGAGGGFIIVPVLMFLIRVPIKKAIGTSLCIIALNSLIGFTGNISHMTIEWGFLSSISVVCIAGIVLGNAISHKISADKLKPAFGWFTLIVGIFVIVKELIVK